MTPSSPDDLLARISKHHRSALQEKGWTDDDMRSLVAALNGLDPLALNFLIENCRVFIDHGADPAQARAWLAALYRMSMDRGRSTARAYRTGVHTAWATRHPDRWIDYFIDSYLAATDGNHDLARLAFVAGLTAEEAAEAHRTGALDQSTLRALAALQG